MRFLHIADLHIGKIVNEFSMLEDQRYILQEILQLAINHQVQVLVIAGDVYDRSVPPAEAVSVFDEFLTAVTDHRIQVVMISGNHDSRERISFLERPLSRQGIHIAGADRALPKSVLLGAKGDETEFVLLPYIKPAQMDAASSEEAVKKVLHNYWEKQSSEEQRARVLVTHFFVTNGGKSPELSDSEQTIHVGGLDNVEVSVLSGFSYVALGHIHKKQQIGTEPVYYAGTPLKYSFGECEQEKGALLVDITNNTDPKVQFLPLHPRHQMRKIKGSLDELLQMGTEEKAENQDYLQAVLTDQMELIDPIATLRNVYPNIMQIVRMEDHKAHIETANQLLHKTLTEKKDMLHLFELFYQEVCGQEISEEQRTALMQMIREIEEQ